MEELDIDSLDKVVAGVTREVAEQEALNNPDLFRQAQIDRLKQEREALQGADKDEMTEEELAQVVAGRDPKFVEQEQGSRTM